MKQNLAALNDYLFEALDTLSNPDLHGEELKEEIKRSGAIQKVAGTIIANADLTLKAKKYMDEYNQDDSKVIVHMIGENDGV